MEAEAKKKAPLLPFPSAIPLPCPPFSLLRLRKPLLRSIAQVQWKFQEVERETKSWLAAQPLVLEASISGAAAAFQGAVLALSISHLAGEDIGGLRLPASLNLPLPKPHQIESQKSSSSPLIDARNFAVMEGANAVISCSMRRIRGKDDLQSRMVAGFGSGAAFSVVSGMGGESLSHQAAFAISSGVFFAALHGGLFQISKVISSWSSSNRPCIEAKVGIDSVHSRQSRAVFNVALCPQIKSALDNSTTVQRDLLSDGTLALENSLRPFREASLQMALCMPLLTGTSSEMKKLQ